MPLAFDQHPGAQQNPAIYRRTLLRKCWLTSRVMCEARGLSRWIRLSVSVCVPAASRGS